jgi:type II restriction enzyme
MISDWPHAMRLECDLTLAARYTSQAQIARVLTESWFAQNGYCLSCDCEQLARTAANSKASDFLCPSCAEAYELKAFRSAPPRRLVDGAYGALISRLRAGNAPTLVLMHRDLKWNVQELTAIHHLFITPEVVEMRKPLSPGARRAGWIGCNIRLDLIGPDARIPIVRSGILLNKEQSRSHFKTFQRLSDVPLRTRGWTTLTLKTIRKFGRPDFTLNELYAFEADFAERYPNNNNIRPKIRQQLQVLRDLGLLKFKGPGRYGLII